MRPLVAEDYLRAYDSIAEKYGVPQSEYYPGVEEQVAMAKEIKNLAEKWDNDDARVHLFQNWELGLDDAQCYLMDLRAALKAEVA